MTCIDWSLWGHLILISFMLLSVPIFSVIFLAKPAKKSPPVKSEPVKPKMLRYPTKHYCERHLIYLRPKELCVVVNKNYCDGCNIKLTQV